MRITSKFASLWIHNFVSWINHYLRNKQHVTSSPWNELGSMVTQSNPVYFLNFCLRKADHSELIINFMFTICKYSCIQQVHFHCFYERLKHVETAQCWKSIIMSAEVNLKKFHITIKRKSSPSSQKTKHTKI